MYFVTPFANAGDKTTIPAVVQPDGSVSYPNGFGTDYQLNPDTDPAALDVERDKMNEILYQITKAVQRLQQFYAPDWIAAADNGGVAFSYNSGAIVLYTDGNYWQSIVGANTATPSTDPTKWIQFLSNYATGAALAAEIARAEAAEATLTTAVAQAAPPGAIMAFALAAVPAGWLACDGTSYLRATYPALNAYLAVGGYLYGAADGTHFNVPDFRNAFLRGFGAFSLAYAASQAPAIQDHTHYSGVATLTNPTPIGVYGSTANNLPGAASRVAQEQNAGPATQPITSGVKTSNVAVAGDTHPLNFAVNWCIKT